jgi:hypothetical protein
MGDTTVGTGLVRPAGGPRAKVTVRALQEFLDRVVEQARSSYVQAMSRAAVRRELHRFSRDHQLDRARSKAHAGDSPGMTFVKQLLRLYRAGATSAELQELAAFPLRAMQQLVSETRSLDHLDREETHLDGLEDELQMRRRILMVRPAGITAAALTEEAEACARAAALYAERERALLAEAARVERCGGMVA